MNSYCIYIHTNLKNGKVYIGQTNNVERRWSNNGIKYRLSPRFWSAIQHYGWENFSHKILEDNLTKDQADQKEKYYIKKYDSTNLDKGYNLTQGGTGGDTHRFWSEERKNQYIETCKQESQRRIEETDWKEKLSEAQKKWWCREKESGNTRNFPKGKNHKWSKPVICIETGQYFDSCADAAEWVGYPRSKSSFISRVANGDRNTCKGYHWKFAEKEINNESNGDSSSYAVFKS